MRSRIFVLFAAVFTLALTGCDLVAPISEVNGCDRVQAIDIGESTTTALTENDCTNLDAPVDYYAFESDGGVVTITVTPVQGDAFQASVALLTEDGDPIVEEEASGEGAVTLTRELDPGVYAIGVMSLSGFGTYELTVE